MGKMTAGLRRCILTKYDERHLYLGTQITRYSRFANAARRYIRFNGREVVCRLECPGQLYDDIISHAKMI